MPKPARIAEISPKVTGEMGILFMYLYLFLIYILPCISFVYLWAESVKVGCQLNLRTYHQLLYLACVPVLVLSCVAAC